MKSINTRDLVYTALLAAMICVLAPWSVPVGPVPITLASLAVMLAAALAGAKRGTAATAVYILLGTAGVPVFSGFSGGAAKLLGPTGGFIVGYLPLALIVGLACERWNGSRVAAALSMICGTAALYACGTAWFIYATGSDIRAALAACVLPFLVGDALKIAVVTAAAQPLARRLDAVVKSGG